ncbi:TPA: ATP-dependent DNA helicase PcrA [Candidatus Sumerlaeota bacterium]|nr:ATP-dependent DNA helicase PcrA [Candidatus Sumerlaeota bacterium]
MSPEEINDQHPLLRGLNSVQQEAVTRTEGPLMIIAGAGSGKTRVITHRIAWLITEKQVHPWRIFAATFTNKAAKEMRYRVLQLCQSADAKKLAIGTFHAQCAAILRRESDSAGLTPQYTICDSSDQIALLRNCVDELGFDKKHLTPGSAQEIISLAKMKLLEGQEAYDFIEARRGEQYARVYERYQQHLRKSDAVDFDDLLLLVVKIWQDNPAILEHYQSRYQYILVDEYQDTNLAQFEIVRLLAGKHHNLCVVGDEDQSIYSWRGAEITNLLEFQERFPDAFIIRLEQNYRSTGSILEASHAVISRNTQRLGKRLWTDGAKGDPIIVLEGANETDEARRIAEQIARLRYSGTPLDEMAIFYRVNALSRVYEDALRQAQIPYRVVGGIRFYDRKEIKDLIAYLQVIVNPGNLIALLRIINEPKRSLGDTAVSKLVGYAHDNNSSVFEVLLDPTLLAAAGLKGKTANSASTFANMIAQWRYKAEKVTPRELVESILAQTGYKEAMGDPKAIETAGRLENIDEFLNALDEFHEQMPEAALFDYLELIALRGADEGEVGGTGSVSLMTIHNAKGLEFDVVFIAALEKDIFPNARAVREQNHNEEERRLFYVALTRAKKRAYLCNAWARRLYGHTEPAYPSIFLNEIPRDMRISLKEAMDRED